MQIHKKINAYDLHVTKIVFIQIVLVNYIIIKDIYVINVKVILMI